MTKAEFKQMFIKMINFGWANTDYFRHLNAVANDDAQLAKVHNMANLLTYRYCIDTHDALHSLISHGKV